MAQDTLQAYTRTICGQSALDSALRRCDCLFHATKVMTLFEIWNKKNDKKKRSTVMALLSLCFLCCCGR